MSRPPAAAGPAEPARYELRVQGVLDPRWSAWFEGLQDGRQSARELLTFLGNLRGGVAQEQIDRLAERLKLDPSRPIRGLSKGNKHQPGAFGRSCARHLERSPVRDPPSPPHRAQAIAESCFASTSARKRQEEEEDNMSHVHADINPQDAAIARVDHQPGVVSGVESLPDETPTIGTFATGLSNYQPRPWSGKQMIGAR